MVLTADGSELLVGEMDGALGLWDVSTGRPVRTFQNDGGVRHLALGPGGEVFACPGKLKPLDVELRSARSGEVLARLPMPDDQEDGRGWRDGTRFTFTPDGKWLVVARENGPRLARHPVRVFDVATQRAVREFGEGGVTALAVSPDGRAAATGGEDGAIGLWDLATGDRRDWFGSGQWTVRGLAFGADGKTLYAGGDDGTIRGWAVKP